MHRVVVLLAAVLVALLAGCSSSGAVDGAEPAPTAVPGLSADLVQQRADVEARRIQVELTLDSGAAPLDVTGLQLRSAAFPGAAPTGRAAAGVQVLPGAAVDLAVDLGPPSACTAQEERDPGGESSPPLPATAVLALADGASAAVDLPDADRHLARAHAEACAVAAAAAVVPARWDPAWTTTGSGADLRAVGVLHLGPVAPGGTAALEGVGSTPLFHWHLPGGPVRLGAGQSADVAVVLEPARCDAHALADDKRGFGPQLQLSLDGAPAVPVRLWVPRPDRAVATGALVGACAGGP
ncbi:hypothetical protein FHN55_12040 [Streptomyces sp. NP160]|uniref:hypothetical protein n=1 Tax=Streptomyces sp. NP160 TaxID=2586637 RepID=UPI00111A4CFD|nr:hypothetical protein [Streptomyces sp. NP160]TNM66969.1 hypothetical protein FHN55_12040 [Streptomyces sp. NP160]